MNQTSQIQKHSFSGRAVVGSSRMGQARMLLRTLVFCLLPGSVGVLMPQAGQRPHWGVRVCGMSGGCAYTT